MYIQKAIYLNLYLDAMKRFSELYMSYIMSPLKKHHKIYKVNWLKLSQREMKTNCLLEYFFKFSNNFNSTTMLIMMFTINAPKTRILLAIDAIISDANYNCANRELASAERFGSPCFIHNSS